MQPSARLLLRYVTLLVVTLPFANADAHVFTQPYTLPVPFSIYAVAASLALLLSFVVTGLLTAGPRTAPRTTALASREVDVAERRGHTGWTQAVSVALLGVCIVTGFLGSQNPFANFNMTFFWIGFVLAVPYAVAVAGDFYAAANPWKALVFLVQRASTLSFEGRIGYPAWLGYAPGLVCYGIFIWLELFGQLLPRGLSVALTIYSVITVCGAYVFGSREWFRYGEFFGVLLALIGKMSPWARSEIPGRSGSCAVERRRIPFLHLLDEPAADMTLVLFILFMLSSTAFDGLHSTLPWVTVYWKHLYPALSALLPPSADIRLELSTQLYYVWQWAMLALSPFLYLAVFSVFIVAMKRLTKTDLSVRFLMLRFAMPLVPIAFVYHVTHYYTLLLAQGPQMLRLISDPLFVGWNLFGTADMDIQPLMLDVGGIWLTQVALILAGHIVSVYLSHREALRLFGSPRRAAISQLPLLLLMTAFTNFGLWILSLPIARG